MRDRHHLRSELRAFAILLLLCNAPMLLGHSTDVFAFLPRFRMGLSYTLL